MKSVFTKTFKEFMDFFKSNIFTTFCVFFAIAIIITLIFTGSFVKLYEQSLSDTKEVISTKILFGENLLEKLKMLGITLLAAVVPYVYLPWLGFLGYMYNEVLTVAKILSVYGMIKGGVIYLIIYLLNILTLCLITSLGIYFAKILTIKFRLSRVNSFTFAHYKLKLYEAMSNEKKCKEMEEKISKREEKLKNKLKKIDIKNSIVLVLIAAVIQIISVAMQCILF